MQHRVVLVALLRGSRVLLGHRAPSREWLPNVWDFPGGHVEEGESPTEALAREVLEELGVVVSLSGAEPVLHLVSHEDSLDVTVWATRTWRGLVRNVQPAEHDELRWCTLDECEVLVLADDAYPPVLRRLLRDPMERTSRTSGLRRRDARA